MFSSSKQASKYQDPQVVVHGHPLTSKGLSIDTPRQGVLVEVAMTSTFCVTHSSSPKKVFCWFFPQDRYSRRDCQKHRLGHRWVPTWRSNSHREMLQQESTHVRI